MGVVYAHELKDHWHRSQKLTTGVMLGNFPTQPRSLSVKWVMRASFEPLKTESFEQVSITWP